MAATTAASSNEQQQAVAAAATAGQQRTSVTHSNYNHLHDPGAANAKEHSRRQQQQQRGGGGGDNKANLAPFDDSHNSVSSSSVSSESSSALVAASSSSPSSSSSSSTTPTTASVSQSISSSDKQPRQEQPLDGRQRSLDRVVNESTAHSGSVDYVTFPLLPHDSGRNSSNSNNININNCNTNGVLHKQDNLLAHLPAYYNNNYSSPSNLILRNNNNNTNSGNYLETRSGQLFDNHLTTTRTKLVDSIETNSNSTTNLGETSERRRRRSQSIRRHKELAKNGNVCEQVAISERQNFNFELQGQHQQQQQFNRNSTRLSVMQQQLSGDYYQSAPSQQQATQSNSLTGSQPTTCDESPLASSSNTDESNRNNIYTNNQLATSTTQSHFLQQQYSNQDSDTYHYYQVVVPESTINASTKRHVDDRAMRFGVNGNNTFNDTSSSPTSKNINRIVNSLFNNNHQQQKNNLPEQVPSVNQNLVISEPLIRSSSWQNKTLIDLNRQHRVPPLPPPPPLPAGQMQHHLDQSASTISYNHAPIQYNSQHHHATLTRYHQHQQQYPMSHATLEPAAIRTTNGNNIELAHIEPPPTTNQINTEQEQEQAHFYCGVNTLRSSSNNNNNSLHQQHNHLNSINRQHNKHHYAINYDHHNPPTLEPPQPNNHQSFQTLVNKMVTNEHKYLPMNSLLAYPGNNYVNNIENEINAKLCSSSGGGGGRTAMSGSSSSDNSTLNGIGIGVGRFDLTDRNKQKSRRGEFCCNLLKSTKLCFLLFLLSASACFILVALLSNYNPTMTSNIDNDQLTSTATTMSTLIPPGLLDKGKSVFLKKSQVKSCLLD